MSDMHSRVEDACTTIAGNHQQVTFTAVAIAADVATLRITVEELADRVRRQGEQIRRLNRLTTKPTAD